MGVEEKNNILPVFCSSARPFEKAKECLMTRKEKEAAERYILDNCDEVSTFIEYLSRPISITNLNKYKYNIISLLIKFAIADNIENN